MSVSPPAEVTVATPASAAPSVVTPDVARAPNVVFIELLGNGLVYSVNYERLLSGGSIGLRAGVSFFTYAVSNASGSGNLTLATFPFVASYYYGTVHHKLQLGLGATVLALSASSDSTGAKYEGSGAGLGVAATAVIGYRYVRPAGGFTFGAGFTPLLRPSKGLLPWGGLSAGYSF